MMKYKVITGSILIAMLMMAGCHRKMMTGDELLSYMADPSNGLVKQVKLNNVHVMVQYLPSAYEVWQDVKQGFVYTQQQADSAQKNYHAFYYFRMMIKGAPPAKEGPDYFNFGIREELALVSQRDTLVCSICQRIVNGNNTTKEYLLVFPCSETDINSSTYRHDLKLLFTGSSLGLKPQEFRFSKSGLNKIPRLKI